MAKLARQANRLYGRYKANQAEIERLSEEAGEPLERANTRLVERLYQLEDESVYQRTRTAEGAMFQPAALFSMAHDPLDRFGHRREIEGLVYSLMTWLEETSGLKREDVLRQAEMRREDDPLRPSSRLWRREERGHAMPDLQLRRSRHSVSALHVHLVFVTKYRRKVLRDPWLDRLARLFAETCEAMEARLLACDGETDHVHLLVEYPPKLSVSTVAHALKGRSSRALRKEQPNLVLCYWRGVLWTPSYFAASAGGAPLTVLRRYVEQQRASSPP